MALTSLDRLMSWCKEDDFPANRQEELDRCIDAASRLIARAAGRQLERVTRSIVLDGDNACGRGCDILYLPAGDRPVIHTTNPNVVTVSECGAALSVAAGYSTVAGVVVDGANQDRRARLIRLGAWAWGLQNIAVTYKCGWLLDDAKQPVPDEVIHLANCVAWMLFREPGWLGKVSVSDGGFATTLSSDLPAYEYSVLQSLTVL